MLRQSLKKNTILVMILLGVFLIISVNCGSKSYLPEEEVAAEPTIIPEEEPAFAPDGSDCSDDDSAPFVVGTYIYTLNNGNVQVRIFMPNCKYCTATLVTNAGNAKSDGTWSSEFLDDSDDANIHIYAGIEYELAPNQLSLTALDFNQVFARDQEPTHTCDATLVD
ncbi:MAG: hypothetical protein ABII18_09425 [bacterium]|nr:hypothetical protein [bacterium]MBU1918886.1 hypothetical protein [bacterium]